MSWSVQKQGFAAKVAESLAGDFERMKGNCSEPEETIKNLAAEQIAASLASFPPEFPVSVTASGYQQYVDFSKNQEEKLNSLQISIQPIYNWAK